MPFKYFKVTKEVSLYSEVRENNSLSEGSASYRELRNVFINAIDKYKYKNLHAFLSDTRSFCRENFRILTLAREKRSIEFITPEYVKISYEYDVDKYDVGCKCDNLVYLFNPLDRLDWLKISINNKRLIIASKDRVKEFIFDKIKEDIDALFDDNSLKEAIKINSDNSKIPESITEDLVSGSKEILKDIIWNIKEGYPCFIDSMHLENKSCYIVELSYFKSVKYKNNNNHRRFLLNPIPKYRINYSYLKKDNVSSWLYIKAPNHLKVNLFLEKGSEIGKNESQNIKAYRFKANEGNVEILVDIANSLNIWYISNYWLLLFITILILLCIANMLLVEFDCVFFNAKGIDYFLPPKRFEMPVILLLTSLIATRSFLLTEETLLKKYSYYVFFATIFMLLSFLIYILLKDFT